MSQNTNRPSNILELKIYLDGLIDDLKEKMEANEKLEEEIKSLETSNNRFMNLWRNASAERDELKEQNAQYETAMEQVQAAEQKYLDEYNHLSSQHSALQQQHSALQEEVERFNKEYEDASKANVELYNEHEKLKLYEEGQIIVRDNLKTQVEECNRKYQALDALYKKLKAEGARPIIQECDDERKFLEDQCKEIINLWTKFKVKIETVSGIIEDKNNPRVKLLGNTLINSMKQTLKRFTDLANYILTLEPALKIKVGRDKLDCNTIYDHFTDLSTRLNERSLNDQQSDLINVFEDVQGQVRTYIRIRPLFAKEDGTIPEACVEAESKENSNKSIVKIVNCNNKDYFHEYAPLSVFGPDTYINNDVPTIFNHIKPIMDQTMNGYSILVFGYGVSGSGKTYVLLYDSNKDPSKSLFYLTIQDFIKKNSSINKVKVHHIFELYSKDKSEKSDLSFRCKGHIINLYNEFKFPENSVSKKFYSKIIERSIDTSLPNRVNPSLFTEENVTFTNSTYDERIRTLLQKIDKIRLDKQRIKETVKNPESSRSHLFIVIRFMVNDDTVGYCTFVDTAGREDPQAILDETFPGTRSFDYVKREYKITPATSMGTAYKTESNTSDLYGKLNPKLTKTLSYYLDVLREGVFINESINHLVWYFQKSGRPDASYKAYHISEIAIQESAIDTSSSSSGKSSASTKVDKPTTKVSGGVELNKIDATIFTDFKDRYLVEDPKGNVSYADLASAFKDYLALGTKNKTHLQSTISPQQIASELVLKSGILPTKLSDKNKELKSFRLKDPYIVQFVNKYFTDKDKSASFKLTDTVENAVYNTYKNFVTIPVLKGDFKKQLKFILSGGVSADSTTSDETIRGWKIKEIWKVNANIFDEKVYNNKKTFNTPELELYNKVTDSAHNLNNPVIESGLNDEVNKYLSNEKETSVAMVPILQYINDLPGTQAKPTKYLMFCMVRQECSECEQVNATLDFADLVKSS
jgi:hypothetical protein